MRNPASSGQQTIKGPSVHICQSNQHYWSWLSDLLPTSAITTNHTLYCGIPFVLNSSLYPPCNLLWTDTTSELQLLNNLIGSRHRTGGHHNITYPVRGNVTIRRHLNNTNDYDWNRNFVAKEWDDATTNDSRRRRPLANKMRQDRRTSQQDGQASQPSNKQRPTTHRSSQNQSLSKHSL